LPRWLARFLFADLFSVRRGFSTETTEADRSSSGIACVSLAAAGGCVGGKVIWGIGPPVYSAMPRGDKASARSEIATGAGISDATRPESSALPYSEGRSAAFCRYNSVATTAPIKRTRSYLRRAKQVPAAHARERGSALRQIGIAWHLSSMPQPRILFDDICTEFPRAAPAARLVLGDECDETNSLNRAIGSWCPAHAAPY